MAHILIIGATSDIAKSLANVYASQGNDLYLTARNPQDLEKFSKSIKVKHNVEVKVLQYDITSYDKNQEFYEALSPQPQGVIVASGYMTMQDIAENSLNLSQQTMNVNLIGPINILNIVANSFEKRKEGFIIGISSVAGDRGRASNYIYGSAKAGLTAYLSGLRNRLFAANVSVLTVKPGFVDTKMTKGLDLPENLTVQPDDVALDIYNAQQKNKSEIYTKSIWRYIMFIIRNIPEFIFKRLSI